MIHLDHNHSSSISSPANPQNILLSSNSPHADQHRILSWSSPARDRQYYQDPQEQFLSDQKHPLHSDKLSADPSPALVSVATAPTDSDHPALPDPSPSSPPDAPSPPADSTSSLTPPPDAATPNNAMDPPDDPPGHPPKTSATKDKAQTGEHAADDLDRASRQSTPLSELSSAPETVPDDEAPTHDDPSTAARAPAHSAVAHPNGGLANSPSGAAKENSLVPPAPNPSKQPGSRSLHLQNPPSSSSHQTHPSSLNPFADHPSLAATDPRSIPSDGLLAGKATQSHQVGHSFLPDGMSAHHPLPSGSQLKTASLDPKVVTILELNSLLLRVSMEYQGRGVPMTDPHFHQYSLRLQSNLTWLAAAADENHKVSQSTMALPVMQPPPAVEFVEMERILQLYRELPTTFQKEIQRRQQSPGGLMNGNAKRERTEEPGQDGMHKRRDTGETKAQIPASFSPTGAGPSTPHPPSQQMQVPNAGANMNMAGGPVPRMSSPSMPPPPVPPGAMTNEAHIARRRAFQQQHPEGGRQMSPPSGMSMSNVAGPGPSSMPNMTPAQISGMTPQTMQHFQILQNKSHPVVQLLMQRIPGFMQLPLQDKLQHMQVAQNMMQARQQQQFAAQAQGVQGTGSMGGFSQSGTQGNITLQHPGDGSPSRMSPPVSQQSPLQPSFPQGNNQSADSRAMMTTQQLQQHQLQQRQYLLLQHQQQQQHMLRAGGAGGGVNLQILNQQRFEQQRMAQAQAQAAASGQGSPGGVMGSPMVDGPQFPALRSNPGMPGIARSVRTPSDSVPSPVSQQRLGMSGQSPEEQRGMMLQQAQQRGMTPQMQNAGFGNGGMPNSAYMAQMGMGGGGSGQNAFGMVSPPGSAGGMGGGAGFGPGGVPSPAGGNSGQMWGQNHGAGAQGFQGGGPFMVPSPSASQHDGMTPGRQTSATPGPHQQMGHNLAGDQSLDGLDFFNWV